MSVISRDLQQRPASRASAAESTSSRPVYLLERCIAIRFEKIHQATLLLNKANGLPPKSNRPGSSLSSWLPWRSSSSSTIRPTAAAAETAVPVAKDQAALPSLVKDSAAPAGWIYDGGFVLYQNFQEANGYCYWNGPLLEAVTSLTFVGHVTPATILVTADESCLETVRSAWARKVLRAPSGYLIALVGDVDGCAVQPISQSQFTPLPEALCWVIWELNLAERSAALDDVTAALGNAFPDLVPPGHKVVYDTLGKLIRDRKIFYNGRGYGVVTPDTYRKTNVVENGEAERGLLLSNEEALALAHGTVESYPAGNVIHKAIQTNLVDVICRGNGTEKVLYGRTAEEIIPVVRPRLQRQRSLRMFQSSTSSTGTGRRLSWSEYRSSAGGSLKLSSSKAKKLMEASAAANHYVTDWEDADETEHPVRRRKEKVSLLSRLFRRRSPSKKRTSSLNTFSAQFPPPEWLDPSKGVLHLHSVAVQTNSADMVAAAESKLMSSARSECSTSLSFSSPSTPTRRSLHRRVTLSQPPSRSDSCSPLRSPPSVKLSEEMVTMDRRITHRRGSPATSISSGLGRSFSPASAHSYQRPMGSILRNQSPPSPTQSTDSLYSSSVGPSASATCRSPVPSLASKMTTFSQDRPFRRSTPDRASYGAGMGRYRAAPFIDTSSSTRPPSSTSEYQPFQRLAPSRSASFRQPRTTGNSNLLMGSSTPRPYVPLTGRLGLDEQKKLIAQQRATIRDHFFQTQLTAPPLISSVMSSNKDHPGRISSSPARSTISSVSNNKKYYETDLDLTIKVPKKSSEDNHQQQSSRKSSVVSESGGSVSSPASRVINISVTKSESLNYVSQSNDSHQHQHILLNKENAVDDIKITETTRPNFTRNKSNEDNFRTFPSLTELNINFKSITGQKILQGLNSNSTDTLVEVNMREGEVSKTDLGYI